MEALLLNGAQAAALRAANGSSGQTARRIEPVEVADDQFMLNADVLGDPFFAGAGKPWRAVLNQVPAPKESDPKLEQLAVLAAARVNAQAGS